MKKKSKVLFLFLAFMFTFAIALEVKASCYDYGDVPTCTAHDGCSWNYSTGCTGTETSGGGGGSSGGSSGSTSGPSAPCCENGTRTITDAYGCNQCRNCTAGACPTPDPDPPAPTTVTCSAGQYLPGQSSTCATCLAGYYCSGGTWRLGDSSPSGLTKCPNDKPESAAGSSSESACHASTPPAPTTVTCSAGQYLPGQSSTCATCLAGYYCPGGTWNLGDSSPSGLTKCPNDKPESAAGSSSASACHASSGGGGGSGATGEYSCYCNPINSRCEWRNTNANNWVPVSGIANGADCQQYSSNYSVGCFTNGSEYKWRTAAEGWTFVGGISTQQACETSHYEDPTSGRYSLTCPSNQIKIGEIINCTFSTNTEATLASAATSGGAISAGAGGRYVSVKGERLGGAGVYGIASDGNRTNNVQITVVESYEQADACGVSVSTSSQHTSQTGDETDNDYYIVTVNVSGKGCNGGTVTFHATNAKNVTPGSQTLTNMGTNTVSTSFLVYPIACKDSYAWAVVNKKGGGTVRSNNTSTVKIMGDWSSTPVCEHNPSYTDFQSADSAGSDVYYSDLGTCSDGTTGYRLKWTRGGCGSGGGPSPSETDKCYKNKTNGLFVCGKYASQTSTYAYVADDCNSDACKNPTEPVKACYKNKTTGEYKFDLKTNLPTPNDWVYVDLDEANCKKPTEEEKPACYYIEETEKYEWGLFDDVAGYVKTELTKEQCVNPEKTEGCYRKKSDDSFAWGDYAEDNNYEYVASITDKNKCKNACFKCENDEYLWGGYDEYGTCELVPNITTPDSCKPVPVTGAAVSKVIYAISLFLVMAGSGIVVYQLTKTKKELN